MAAPTPEPTALKIAKGNPGKRKLNFDEPQPALGEPEMPKGLSLSARREWKSIVKDLLELGVLSKVDGKALSAYCECFAMWEQARREIKKDGLTFRTTTVVKDRQADGSVKERVVLLSIKRNPAVAIAFESLRAMKSYLVEFGLTPASRSRLHVIEKPKEDDPVASFMAKVAASKQAHAAAN
jgi:P27 family predicted phage terminase small subunit